jgi:hypothetical protein
LPTHLASIILFSVNLEEPAAAYGTPPSADPLLERAEALVHEFPGCFWFRHPEARVRDRGDIALVIRRLREYGDRRAWRAAQDLHKCL